MYDIDAIVEGYWGSKWEKQCSEEDEYWDDVERACEAMRSAYDSRSRLQVQVDEGYDEDTDEELTADQIAQYKNQIQQITDDMQWTADYYGVDLSDCLERLG